MQVPAILVSLTSTTAGAVSQESDAVGAVNDGMAGHWIVVFAPAAPSDGFVVSETVIVWLTEVDSLPEQSFARHVLVRV